MRNLKLSVCRNDSLISITRTCEMCIVKSVSYEQFGDYFFKNKVLKIFGKDKMKFGFKEHISSLICAQ